MARHTVFAIRYLFNSVSESFQVKFPPLKEEYSPAPISLPQAGGEEALALSEETYLSAKLLMNP